MAHPHNPPGTTLGAPLPEPAQTAEQRELAALRDLEADIRQARRNSLGAENFTAVVSAALDRFDRKRATP